MIDTYSVGQVAASVAISKQSVRAWTDRFADHLSDTATPAEGIERRYTSGDIEILATVKNFRGRGVSLTDIGPRIARGDRLDPSEAPEPPPETQKQAPETESKAVATTDLLDRFIVRYEARIDDLEGKLTDEQDARRLAEVEAAQLRGRLEELEKPPAWQFWRR
jgi:DNA-binding transcriptional MerR regulator